MRFIKCLEYNVVQGMYPEKAKYLVVLKYIPSSSIDEYWKSRAVKRIIEPITERDFKVLQAFPFTYGKNSNIVTLITSSRLRNGINLLSLSTDDGLLFVTFG